MNQLVQLVVFCLDEQRYALPLAEVRRVVSAASITLLPSTLPVLLGAIDVQGEIIPVLDLRQRFMLPARELRLTDQFLIARTARRTVALLVDNTLGVIECAASSVTQASAVAPNLQHVEGLIQLEEGLVLVHKLDALLFPDECLALDQVMKELA